MFFTVYKITHRVTGKVYVGVHRTKNLDDGYLGSETAVRAAVKKYGKSAFDKEYLAIFDNEAQMVSLEKNIVDRDFVLSPLTYNLCEGGVVSGFIGQHHTPETLTKKSISAKLAWQEGKFDHVVDKIKETKQRQLADGTYVASFTGKKHSSESIELLRLRALESSRGVGESNPNYGKVWIHHPETYVSKSVSSDDFDFWINEGWLKGRKMGPPKIKEIKPPKEKKQRVSKPKPERSPRILKVSDEDYIRALNEHPSICQALKALGLAPRGKNYTRAKRLLGYDDSVRLTTAGKTKII